MSNYESLNHSRRAQYSNVVTRVNIKNIDFLLDQIDYNGFLFGGHEFLLDDFNNFKT